MSASNLDGRTLTAPILGQDNQLPHQLWALHGSRISQQPRWEPQPLRWLGYNTITHSPLASPGQAAGGVGGQVAAPAA